MERSTAYLYRFLTRQFVGANRDDVRDAISSAQLVCCERAHAARDPVVNEEAFMTCVARRALAASLKREKRHMYPQQAGDEAWTVFERKHLYLDDAHELDAAVESRRLLELLPANYAEVLRMHYLEGITLDEASKRIGVSPECMRKRHERALRMARRALGATYAGKRAAGREEKELVQTGGEHADVAYG